MGVSTTGTAIANIVDTVMADIVGVPTDNHIAIAVIAGMRDKTRVILGCKRKPINRLQRASAAIGACFSNIISINELRPLSFPIIRWG